MSRFRPSGMALLAAIFIIAGFGLMLASLRVESDPTPDADVADAGTVVVPTTAAARAGAALAAVAAPSEERATALFTRAQSAGRSVAYSGVKQVTRFVDGKATVTTVTVQHVPGHGTRVAPGDVQQVGTDGTLTAEPAESDDSTTMQALIYNYQLRTGDEAKYLGREARVVEAHRADGSVAARFLIDEETALVLRRDLFAADGSPTESAEYLKLEVSDTSASPAPTAGVSSAAWSVVDDVGALRAEGWPIPERLEDGLVLYQVREQGTGDDRVVQLGYTDGLLAVSVFLQHGVLDRDAMTGFVPVQLGDGEVWVRNGALFYTWQQDPAAGGDPAATGTGATPEASPVATGPDELVVSALADNPRAPVGAVLAAFPPASADEVGVGDHVTRGVKRVGSWIDPFS